MKTGDKVAPRTGDVLEAVVVGRTANRALKEFMVKVTKIRERPPIVFDGVEYVAKPRVDVGEMAYFEAEDLEVIA